MENSSYATRTPSGFIAITAGKVTSAVTPRKVRSPVIVQFVLPGVAPLMAAKQRVTKVAEGNSFTEKKSSLFK